MMGYGPASLLPGAAFLAASGVFLLSPTVPFATLAFICLALFLFGVLATALVAASRLHPKIAEPFVGLWAAMPMFCLLMLHQKLIGTELWKLNSPVLLATAPIWAADVVAILVGRGLGRTPLWPSISPKKTWEGALGNFCAASLLGSIIGPFVGVGWLTGVACGVAAGVLGQYGDLFESYIKRSAGVKDSGSLLPGHGGMLDRMDSILFTAPAVLLILVLAAQLK